MSKLLEIDDQLTNAVQGNYIASYEAALHKYLKTYKILKEQQHSSLPNQLKEGTSSYSDHEKQKVETFYRNAISNTPKSLRRNAECLIGYYVKENPHFTINKGRTEGEW